MRLIIIYQPFQDIYYFNFINRFEERIKGLYLNYASLSLSKQSQTHSHTYMQSRTYTLAARQTHTYSLWYGWMLNGKPIEDQRTAETLEGSFLPDRPQAASTKKKMRGTSSSLLEWCRSTQKYLSMWTNNGRYINSFWPWLTFNFRKFQNYPFGCSLK